LVAPKFALLIVQLKHWFGGNLGSALHPLLEFANSIASNFVGIYRQLLN
jgi:hypothetical protein